MSTLKEITDQVLLNAYSETYRSMAAQRANAGAREVARRVLWGRTLQTGAIDVTGLVSFATPVDFSRVTRVFTVPPAWPGAVDDWRSLSTLAVCRLRFEGDIGVPIDGCGPSYTMDLVDDGAQAIRVIGVDGSVAVEGYRMPARMVADTDRCALGDGADDAVVAYARAKIAMHENDQAEHDAIMAEFDRQTKLFATAARTSVDGVSQTSGMWEY